MKPLKKVLAASVLVSLAFFQSCSQSVKENTDTDLRLTGQVLNSTSHTITFKQVGTNIKYVELPFLSF